MGALDGLYQFNRQAGTFDRYTDSRGLPSSTIRCIQEDRSGRLWLSTQKGLSRFDPKLHVFRNYDASDGLQSNEFSDGCYQGRDGELFFGGSNGFNSLFPEQIRDNPYVAPLVITSFKIANKPVPIGGNSVLKKAIPYVDFLTLSYTQNDISFEFAALSYANSHKNRYRYKLESYDSEWTNADSKHAFASYTHLDPGKYVFRVQGSNSDGIWNEEGVSLPIVVTPPFWKTNLFRTVCIVVFVAILWTAYRLRVRQLQQAFNNRMQARVEERTRIARELHDTLLQTFQAALIQMQAAYNLFLRRPEKALETLQDAIDTSASAIAEGREAIQQMRSSTVTNNDLARALRVAGDGMAVEGSASFDVRVQGTSRDVDPILREEVYRIALEALRNAFRHAEAKAIEADIVYGANLTVRLRDDGKGIPAAIMEHRQRSGHYGLPGMRERAERIGGKLDVWSGPGAGTEIQLSIPGDIAFGTSGGSLRFRLFRRKNKSKAAVQG